MRVRKQYVTVGLYDKRGEALDRARELVRSLRAEIRSLNQTLAAQSRTLAAREEHYKQTLAKLEQGRREALAVMNDRLMMKDAAIAGLRLQLERGAL